MTAFIHGIVFRKFMQKVADSSARFGPHSCPLPRNRRLGVARVPVDCSWIGDAAEFLNPVLSALHPPELLPDCDEAAERIMSAISRRQKIAIFGDYDVDGMTGTAILYRCLKMLGSEVHYYIPHRVNEGYGLSQETIFALSAQFYYTLLFCLFRYVVLRRRSLPSFVTGRLKPAT